MFRRRETMIALRARRQSFQIATQVAQPHMEVPPPPQPPLPVSPSTRPPPPPLVGELADERDMMPLSVEPPCWNFLRGEIGDILLAMVGIAAGLTLILLVKYG